MKIHSVVTNLINAQNNHDTRAYVECFSDTAVVKDEGKIHKGKAQIQQWIEESNRKYQAVLKALSYEQKDTGNVLTAEVSGEFPGSPAVLHFNLKIKDDLIYSLNITG